MVLASLLLSALLSPQALPPAAEEPPPPAPEAPALATEPTAPDMGAAPAPAPGAGAAEAHIDAGLKAFRRRRFSSARDEFEKAFEADPNSAAAAFYLGYVHYKIAEPTRRLTPEKQQAKELFAKAFALDPTFQPVWGQKKP
jgi:tetratricopeptide (TPR) repeat protein